MRDPFPLAEIPLAAADESNERESPGAAGDLSMRALVPHGSAMATGGAESGEPLRSEDDTALMRSLISLMPHERADSQVRDTKPPSLFDVCFMSDQVECCCCCCVGGLQCSC